MTAIAIPSQSQPLNPARPAPGDLVGLVSAILIIIAYLLLPLRVDGPTTGFAFIDSTTTFPALTLVIGVVGIVTALVSLTVLRETGARWYMAEVGMIGLLYLVDNTLRTKAGFALGGTLAMIGCFGLIVQAVLPRPGYTPVNRTNEIIFGLIRVMVAALWFTQLLWKLPWDNFGCPAGALVPAAGTSGLCDWIGKEIASPRYPIYKDFLTGFITPNIGWLAFFIFAGEAFVCFSLMTGFLTRLGAFIGFGMAINLFIVVGGRFIGLDAILYVRLKRMADGGSPIAGMLARIVS